MMNTELKFNELLPRYIEQYERVNGKQCVPIVFIKGWVYVGGKGTVVSKVRVSKFQSMFETLSKRPDFKEKS